MSSERQEYNEVSPWWGEHVHRYKEAIKHIKASDRILDLACGNGYGSSLLANSTENIVVGGDIDSNSIKECTSRFKRKNLEFNQMDGTKIDYEDDYFDVVISFETIEHTKDYFNMLGEFKRVLKKDGLLILSTPNRLITSPNGIIINPFHTQEWSLIELTDVLNKIFINTNVYGQQFTRYNKIDKIAKYAENFLYMRGIRKIPIKIQNRLMNVFGQKTIYPRAEEFCLVTDTLEINKSTTLFAICRNE